MNRVLMIRQKVRVKKRYSFFYGIESVPFLNCFAISGFVTKIAVSAFHTLQEMIYQPLAFYGLPEPPFNPVFLKLHNLLDS